MEYKEFQFSEGGKRHFALSEDSISITGKGLNVHLPLKGLQPEFRIVRRRSSSCYVGLIGCVLGLVGAAAFLVNQELTFALAIICGVLSLLIVSFSWKRIDFEPAENDNAISISTSFLEESGRYTAKKSSLFSARIIKPPFSAWPTAV